MMDEEIRQAVSEVREMKQMCGNINMKLTNIVTQRGQDWKKKLEAEYQRGLDDAWEAAGKLFSSMADSDIEKAFPIEWNNGGFNALINLQPQEAIAKLKAYEEKQDNKFEFGDEITDSYGTKGCVVSKDNEEGEMIYALFDGYRVPQHVAKSKYRKTGKHYDIEKILEALKA